MKIKRILFSFVLLLSVFFSVSCKDKSEDATKTDPVVVPKIEERVFFVGESLNDIELLLGEGSTSGSISWVDGSYTLTEGKNTCAWKFTPTDTDAYNEKTGSVEINARELKIPEVSVEPVEGDIVYIDAKYDTVGLQATATFEGIPVPGKIVWKHPEMLFKSGRNVCECVFIPTENQVYAQVTTEVVFENVTEEQTIERMALGGISKTEYVAYDKFDKNSLTLCWIYNKDKIEEIKDFQALTTVIYNDGDSLKRGDESVQVRYMGYTVEVTGFTVDYKPVNVPVFEGGVTYDGHSRLLTVPTSQYYNLPEEDLYGTNAGDYDLILTLKDPENCRWANGDVETTVVKCSILKADITDYSEFNYEGDYDTYEYYSRVVSTQATKIYYSETELTEENYLDLFEEGLAYLEPIKKANAGNYIIYYYLETDDNHNGKSGQLTINISKQTPTIDLEQCYTLFTGSIVNYPSSYAKVTGDQNEIVTDASFKITYYTEYSNDVNTNNDVLTTTADGALSEGGAPKNARSEEYYVVVEFLGNQNYSEVRGVTVLYIDASVPELFATTGDGFAFKAQNDIYIPSWVDSEPDYMVDGTKKECNTYAEFSKLELDENGLIVVRAVTKFSSGHDGIKDGRLIYSDESYKILDQDGKIYKISYNEETEELTFARNEHILEELVLQKWLFPKYLQTYTATTVAEDDMHEVNSSQQTTIRIYNDHGTIRFTVDANVIYTSEAAVPGGGNAKWAGVAEIGLDLLQPDLSQVPEPCYFLDCYLITEELNSDGEVEESEGYAKTTRGFRLAWPASEGTCPTTIKIYSNHGTLLTDDFAALLNVVLTAVR